MKDNEVVKMMYSMRFNFVESLNAKPMEWCFTSITLAIGISFAIPIDTFSSSESFKILGMVMREEHWAWLCLVGGFARLIVLWINGSWPKGSPFARGIAATLTCFLWFLLSVAFQLAGNQPPGAWLFPVILFFEGFNALRAFKEAGVAYEILWKKATKSDGS